MKLFFDELNNKITIPSEHWYQSSKSDKWLPSVTSILDVYPKGVGYYLWLQQVGLNSSEILKKAAEIGSEVHALIDEYQKLPQNFKVSFISESGIQQYKWEVWELFCKAMEFFNNFNPEIIAHEFSFASDTLGFGGTIDCICLINGQIWLIDYKSGNMIHESHYLQIAAYSKAWNLLNPNYKIEKAGILHLKASTRKEVEGKIQGKGWQLVESGKSVDEDFDYFCYCQKLWLKDNKNVQPKIKEYPLSFIKL